MTRGPKPQSATLKLLRGNPGHQKVRPGVQAPPGLLTEPDWAFLLPGDDPEELLARGEAAAEWARIVPRLEALGLVTPGLDQATVVDYCLCNARIFQCERNISQNGVAVKGERGWQKNPALTAVTQYRTSRMRLASELLLSPGTRAQTKRPDDGPSDAAAILD